MIPTTSQDPGPGRPRLRDETVQIPFYFGKQEANELLAERELVQKVSKGKTKKVRTVRESAAELLRKAARLLLLTKKEAKNGCPKAAALLAAVALEGSPVNASALPQPEETHHEIYQAPSPRPCEYEVRDIEVGDDLFVVGTTEMGEPTPPALHGQAREQASLPLPGMYEEEPIGASDGASRKEDFREAGDGDGLPQGSGAGNLSDGRSDTPQARPPRRPEFWPRYEADGRGQEISNLRKQTWEEFPQELAIIDEGTNHLSKNVLAFDNCIVEWYQSNLSRLRNLAECEREAAKERAEREAERERHRQELAKPTLAKMVYPISDPLIRDEYSLEFFEKEFEAQPRFQNLAEYERWESKLIDRIEEGLLEHAKFEGGKCPVRSSLNPEPSVAYGEFSKAGAAAQIQRVKLRLQEYRLERKRFRKERARQFSTQGPQLEVITAPQLPLGGIIIEQPEKPTRTDPKDRAKITKRSP